MITTSNRGPWIQNASGKWVEYPGSEAIYVQRENGSWYQKLVPAGSEAISLQRADGSWYRDIKNRSEAIWVQRKNGK